MLTFNRKKTYINIEQFEIINHAKISLRIWVLWRLQRLTLSEMSVELFKYCWCVLIPLRKSFRTENICVLFWCLCGAVLCSYPAVLVVPQSSSDDSIHKFSRSYRQNRLALFLHVFLNCSCCISHAACFECFRNIAD